MTKRLIKLKPVKETPSDFDDIEKQIEIAFRKLLYIPLLNIIRVSDTRLVNSTNRALLHAIETGQVTFNQGLFSGRFSAAISRDIKSLGGVWDKKTQVFKLPSSKLPEDVKSAIAIGQSRFLGKLKKLDERLAKILPEEIAGSLKTEKLFDASLYKIDKEFSATLKNITVSPKLTESARKKIAAEWQENLELCIKDFADEEILKLRKNIAEHVAKGGRYEAVIKDIQRSYGVTQNKAKFLARQETSLMMTKFKETRYTEAGIHEYEWRCVAGSKNHPVRPAHKKLEGKVFRWDSPPITSEPNQPVRKNNPGQDYNCRCFAIPIVRLKEDTG